MKRATIVGVACALLVAAVAWATQDWRDNQSGQHAYSLSAVTSVQADNLIGSGNRCTRVDSTGKLIPASFDCLDPSTLAYQHWSDGAFSLLPQEPISTAGAGLSIADDPGDSATVISLPALGTATSCTDCSISKDLFGRITLMSSGPGSGVSSVTGTAQQVSATPTTGAVVVGLIGGFYSGATTGGNQNLSLLSTGVAKINVAGTASFSIAATGTDIAPVGSCGSHQFATATNAASLTCAQPAFTDLSGSQSCAQKPAQTGDVTSAAGSCATTVASVACAALPAFTGAVGKPLASCVTTINAVPCGALPAFTGGITSPGGTCATTVASVPCSALPTGTCGSITTYGSTGNYIASVTVDGTLRVPSVTTTTSPLAGALVYTIASSSIAMGYNQSTLVMPLPGGAPIVAASSAGVPIGTALAANWGSSTTSPPTFPLHALGSVLCSGDITNYTVTGPGSPALVMALYYVTSPPVTPANWHLIASGTATLPTGGGTFFNGLGLSASSGTGLIPAASSVVLVFYRSDAGSSTTLTALNANIVCEIGS